MSPPRSKRCAEARALAPEIALGIADGELRARALRHVAGCKRCRGELEQLSAVADDVLTLAPEREPPPGFEARVLERLELDASPRPARRRRPRLRHLSLAGAALAIAAVTAVAMTIAYGGDHRLASQYRSALRGAGGEYFQSATLRAPDGAAAGTVFAYQGSPSWVFYVLRGRYRAGSYAERIVTRSGRSIGLPRFRLVDSSWGVATPVPLREIAAIRLVRLPGGAALHARLPAGGR